MVKHRDEEASNGQNSKAQENYHFKPTLLLNISILLLIILIALLGIFISSGLHYLMFFQPILFAALILVALNYFGVDKKTSAILFFIFLLAYTIRCQNLQPGYDYFFEFDSFYHTRMTGYILQNGAPPKIDNAAYYELPDQYKQVPFDGQFFWYFSAAFYKLFSFGASYDKNLLVETVKVLPAFYGALVCLFMFFFAKELFGRKVGFVTAFATATMQAYAYRTMGGFFEDDSLGFLGLVLGFIFFFRAVKEKGITKAGIINALLAGFFFAFMGWSWALYPIISIILLLSFPFVFLLLLAKALNEKNIGQVTSFLLYFVVSITLFTLLLLPFRGLSWPSAVFSYISTALSFEAGTGLGLYLALGFVLFTLGFILVVLFKVFASSHAMPVLLRALASILLFASFVFVFIATVIDPNGFFSNRFVEKGIFMSTVGEESPGKSTFGYKYNMQIVFPWLALFFIPFFVFFKKDEWLSPYAFVWIAVSLFMAWHKLKFTYAFGLPVALAAGVVAAMLFFIIKHLEGKQKGSALKYLVKPLILSFLFLLVGSVAASYYFMLQHPPNIETAPEWKAMLWWIRDNTPKDAKIFNWWSYGHWVTFIGERNAFSDNRNIDWEISDGEYARFAVTEDVNEALDIMRKYKPDYLLLSSDTFYGFHSMYIYAYKVHKDELLNDPKTRTKVRAASGNYMRCSIGDSNKYICGSNVLSEEQMASLPNKWQAKPSYVEEGKPRWIYRDIDNNAICIVESSINNSVFAKIWFNADDVKPYFELVHVEMGGTTVKLYKLNKEALK